MNLALDKASARRIDANGYLHVEPNPISKATVNPYKGDEIPGCKELGLDPNKVYYLLRDPKELKKAAPTFNNLPILSKHIPVSSFDMDKPDVKALYVGSTGTDAEFDGTYLNNTLVLHAKSAIDDIQAKKKHELSCAYRYQPDMTPGTFEGQHYDGIMRDIQGNHVALVTEGRAGHDVKVMDSKNGGAKVVDYRKVSEAMGKDSAEKVRAVLFGIDQKAMDGSITKEVQGSDYETAEAAAKSAGTLAGMQPTPENRKQAARLSREAARLHRSAGFAKQAKYWDEVADEFSKPAGGAKDSNPEGINQYSGGGGKSAAASSKAWGASEKALSATSAYNLSHSAASNQKAFEKHDQARRMHNAAAGQATSGEKSAEHQKMSDHHKKEAIRHLNAGAKLSHDSITADISKRKDVSAKQGITEYGEVTFADPKNNKYPLDTPEHVRTAAPYFGMTKNKSQYGKEDQTKIDKRISAAERKFKLGKFAEGK